MGLLDGELAEIIGDAMGGADLFYDATLTRTSTTGGDPFDPGGGGSTSTDYACMVIEDMFSAYDLANSLVQAGDVKVIILATTLAVTPTTADAITTRGVKRSIIKVDRDPAGATWTLQARA